MLRGFTRNSRLDKRTVAYGNSQCLSLNLQGYRAAGFGETVELRVVNLLYRGLMPLISKDGGGNANGERDSCQDHERDSAGAQGNLRRGGGHKQTSKSATRRFHSGGS